jgi:hypothetical protein
MAVLLASLSSACLLSPLVTCVITKCVHESGAVVFMLLQAASTQQLPLGTFPQHTAPSATSSSTPPTDAAIDIQDVPAANTDQHTCSASTPVNCKDAAAAPAAAAATPAACSTAAGPAAGGCGATSVQCCTDSEIAAASGREYCGCVGKLTGRNTPEQKEVSVWPLLR